MKSKYRAAAVAVLTVVIIFVVSAFSGLVIGLATLDWWRNALFNDVYGAPAVMIIVIPVAFLVPFVATLILQFSAWLIIGRLHAKTRRMEDSGTLM